MKIACLSPRAVIAIASLIAQGAGAQSATADVTDLQALRAAVKADKRAFVAATLALTEAQAAKFWPVYDDYQRKLETANRGVRSRSRACFHATSRSPTLTRAISPRS